MSKNLSKELSELLEAQVITEETALKIQEYYEQKSQPSSNRLFIVFGLLGAILVGLGIILIIAHNWDDMSRSFKTILAFFPMLLGQGMCAYSLLKKENDTGWKESSSVFLFISVGACISLVSQIYNIPGNISSFLLTWMLLCLPLVYVMRSSIASLFYILGITYYAVETGYWSRTASFTYIYWILLLLILPHYYFLYKNKSRSNFMTFHNWFIPLSVICSLGTITAENGEFVFLAYIGLFGLLYLIGNSPFFRKEKLIKNGYSILGSLGSIILLLILSFKWFWDDLQENALSFNSSEFYISILIIILAAGLLFWKKKNIPDHKILPMEVIFLLVTIIFFIGFASSILSIILINLLIFGTGLLTIKDGADRNHLGILNYGLLIITFLVICRFFDTNISFVIRGIMFLLIGLGFFFTNYWMIKRRND